MKKLSPFATFPMRILTVALLITIALFLTTAWHIWKSYQDYRKGPSQEYRYQFLLSSLNSGIEMTTLARQVVNNREPGLMGQYERAAREVDTALREFQSIAPDAEILEIVRQLDVANRQLLEIETRAFDFVKQGKWEEARQLLYSDAYKTNMRAFDRHNQVLDREMRTKVEEKVRVLTRRAYFGLAAIAISLPILIFVWVFVLGLVTRHMKERVHREWMNMVFANLEQQLSVISTPREAAGVIFETADQLFGWDACFLSIYDRDRDDLQDVILMDTVDGERRQVAAAREGQPLSPIMRKSIEEGAQLILRGPSAGPEDGLLAPFGDRERRSASLMFTPLRQGDRAVGVLSIQSYKPDAYARKDLELLEMLVDHSTGALDRTIAESRLRRSEEELRRAHDGLEKRVAERTRDLSVANELLQQQVLERQKAQDALALSERIYREAIENASGVPYRLMYDRNDYDFVGPGIHSLLGCEPEEFSFALLRSLVREIRVLDPSASQDHAQYVEDYRSGKVEQYRVDLRVQLPGGGERWISDCSVPIREAGTGRHTGSLGILQDITLRKRAEEEARIHQEQLIHADKMVSLGILVSGVAHEINNPNNFIMLNAPVLREAWQGIRPILDKYYEENGDFVVGGLDYSEMAENWPILISGILEGSDRIRNIVQELRDFARQDPGFFQDNVDMNAVVQSALTLVASMVRNSTDRFSLAAAENLPPVRGNFQRLEQVILNLIQNACQALPDRTRGIEVATSHDSQSQSVIVRVRDEGDGIPKETLKHIMDPFFTTRRDQGGVGLGLSISRNIVQQHGGTLELAPLPGMGAVATLILPTNGRS